MTIAEQRRKEYFKRYSAQNRAKEPKRAKGIYTPVYGEDLFISNTKPDPVIKVEKRKGKRRNKLSELDVQMIRGLIAGGVKLAHISSSFKVMYGSISNIKRLKTWRTLADIDNERFNELLEGRYKHCKHLLKEID